MEEKNFNLKDLIDPKFPMMEAFKQNAPGTYKHCQNVEDLVEPIAIKLELEVDKMMVAARYHDFGKVNHSKAFSENQNGENLHDDLDPYVSYQIITKHVGDTVLYLLQVPEMPRDIIEWISQHHGDTVLRYFWDKAGRDDRDKWRYRCPKPSCIEAAVLMICDSVEATARSMASNGKLTSRGEKEKVVLDTISRLEMDGQLDNVLVGQIRVIKEVLIEELETIYHTREVYPEETEEKEKEENANE